MSAREKLLVGLGALTGLGLLPGLVGAASTDVPTDYALFAEQMRSGLAGAQVSVLLDPAQAAAQVQRAQATYASALAPALERTDPQQAAVVSADLGATLKAAQAGDEPALAAARARAWTAWLGGAYTALEASVKAGDAADARRWLATREFRQASRFTRLNADATEAVEALSVGKVSSAAALAAVQADVLDGYQARLNDALAGVQDAAQKRYATRSAEQSALAGGYFDLLAPAYQKARGDAALRATQADFAALPGSLARVNTDLQGFRAAPLSEKEQRVRAGQVLRFLALVPVEYARGVSVGGGKVTVGRDIEVTEARTFLAGSTSAFADLAPLLRNEAAVQQVQAQLAALQAGLQAATDHAASAPGPDALTAQVNVAQGAVEALFPESWKAHDASGDLDVISTQLDALVAAVKAGDYSLAESARLDAYATLESGPEARLSVFAPDLKVRVENLFWNGDQPAGLARLIGQKAGTEQVQASRALLDAQLKQVRELLGTDVAPAAVATNAGVIVFREGLEAVLILAALMGSLRKPDVRPLRRPMWWGAAAAFVATAITWVIMGGTLSLLARFGERLEAVVGVIAIAVLLVIMNWFVHQVYWTDRMADFQKQKHSLMGRSVNQHLAQWLGLATLGFTSIYREGFETTLFLQSLSLQSGNVPVLSGTAIGLLAVIGVGVLVFALQAKLPMKKLLVWTGMMICAVLAVMVGNTVHVLQLVGWFPVHAITAFPVPAWLSLWFGIYGTWEGLFMQAFAAIAVVGSYYLAEALKERGIRQKKAAYQQASGQPGKAAAAVSERGGEASHSGAD